MLEWALSVAVEFINWSEYMCGGGSIQKIANVATFGQAGLAKKAAEPVLGALSPKLPDLPDPSKLEAQKSAELEAAKTQASEEAQKKELERRRAVLAGGRQSTILAGQQIAQEQQRKTLLGQ